MKKYDTLIVGGGIVGMSIAFHLRLQGSNVVVVDAKHEGRATDAGAGIIAGATTFSEEEEMYQLVSRSSAYYPEFIDLVKQYTDKETGYTKVHELITLLPDGDPERFDKAVKRILARQAEHNYPELGSLRELEQSEIQAKYPHLGSIQKALLFTDAAQVDGRKLNLALVDAGKKLGLDLVDGKVSELVLEDQVCTGVKMGDQILTAERVIIAGGAWSTEFESQLSISTGMVPQRGQIIHLSIDHQIVGELPVMISSDDYYLLQWLPDTVVVGATRESDSGFDPTTTVDGVISVMNAGKKMVPALGEASIKEIRVGLRPYSQDRLPIIGPVPGYDNLWMATGHGPLGLTAAPFTGKIVADMLVDNLDYDLSPFSVTRFFT